MVKEINGKAISSWGCTIYHFLYRCFYLLHCDGLHEGVVMLIVDQRRDVLDHLVQHHMIEMVWFQEKLTEMPR